MSSQITVGLLWHSPKSENLGVGALTMSQIALLNDIAERLGVTIDVVLIGWIVGEAIPVDYGIRETCHVNLKKLLGLDRSLLTLLEKCDLILDIGEGDSFSDIYGWKRLLIQVWTKVLASMGGRRLILSPQTLGPFRSALSRWLADIGMARAKAVCARDRLSSDYFRDRSLGTKLIETTDVAFLLPFVPSERRARVGNCAIGLNVSGLLWSGGYTRNNQFGLTLDYRSTIDKILRFFLSVPGCEIHLIPHVVSSTCAEEDDYRAMEEISRQYSSTVLAGPFSTPSEAKSYISGLDFFAGARMHACIASFSAGVPCIPMAYSRKFKGLFGTLGYDHVADCTAMSEDAVVSMVVEGFNRRSELRAEVASGNSLALRFLESYVHVVEEQVLEVVNGA